VLCARVSCVRAPPSVVACSVVGVYRARAAALPLERPRWAGSHGFVAGWRCLVGVCSTCSILMLWDLACCCFVRLCLCWPTTRPHPDPGRPKAQRQKKRCFPLAPVRAMLRLPQVQVRHRAELELLRSLPLLYRSRRHR